MESLLLPSQFLKFGKLPVLSRPLMPAPQTRRVQHSRMFFVWQLGAEGGNQALGSLNAKCISLIYSDRFSSGYFLYYQTQYPSVKTFVLAE